jgi:methyl halide transferase
MQNLNSDYWNNRYLENKTGWDIGYASPEIVKFAEKITDKEIAILIPGCGNAYEAEALLNLGFKNVTLVDFADTVVKSAQHKFSNQINLGSIKVIQEDFFSHDAKYDLIIEQTFFCALNPELRPNYAKKMAQLLKPKGMLAGLFFNFPLTAEGPPFGGSLDEYKSYFEPFFNTIQFNVAQNSIEPRAGKELFAILEKK